MIDVLELRQRVFAKVDASGDCWDWQAGLDKDGYAKVKVERKTYGAHRFVYELLVGPIPAGLTLDHLCRNRRCVNPDHMEPVGIRINTLRGHGVTAMLARRTHCPLGHPYDGTARGHNGRTERICKRCRNERGYRWRDRKAAAA